MTAKRKIDKEISPGVESVEVESESKRRYDKKHVFLAILGIALAALVYYYKGFFVAAVVDGTPITRISLIAELEKQAGKQALDAIVTKTLILKEAKKLGISLTDSQINDEIKSIEDDLKTKNQKLDDLLVFQGMTRDDFIDRLRIQKLVEKILAKEIAPSDTEVADYVKKNRESFPKDAKDEDMQVQAKKTLEGQKLNEKFGSWLENLKTKAKIQYFI